MEILTNQSKLCLINRRLEFCCNSYAANCHTKVCLSAKKKFSALVWERSIFSCIHNIQRPANLELHFFQYWHVLEKQELLGIQTSNVDGRWLFWYTLTFSHIYFTSQHIEVQSIHKMMWVIVIYIIPIISYWVFDHMT
jgi:hypothetical protein